MLEPSNSTARGAARASRFAPWRALPLVAACILGLGAAGCQTSDPGQAQATAAAALEAPAAPNPTVEDPADIKYFPSDEPIRLGAQHFKEGSYGLAQRYFLDAGEKAPRDAAAWIGLAASYDRLARFDLADRTYRAAIKLDGETTQILNNEGYSYMLRGDLAKARAKFLSAQRRDPDNPAIINNLALLDGGAKYQAPSAQ